MAQYQKQIFDELKRIAEGGRNAYEVAQAREKAMRQNLGSSLSVNADANETQVKLRELEREADTYKSLYQTYLGRYQDAQQQQSFPITEARVISSAVPPGSASYPNKGRVLALFFLFGAGAGAGLGAFREYRDRFFRLGEQVREYLGLEFLGMLPQLPPEPDLFGWPASQGFICCSDGLARHVVKHPLSTFAESLRSAKIAADLAGGSQTATVIGLVSALPGEGKSTVAANFAQLLAMQGSRTLLIDGDLRNPELSRMYGRHARCGLVEVVSDGLALEPALLKDSETGLAFLPSVLKRRVANAGAILASTGMQGLLKSAGTAFDYIVIDLPPLAPVVDVRGFAGHVHAFLMVVEWGRTARKVVASTLQSEIQIAEKCAGVLLNKADVEKLKLYRSYGSSEYYMSRFSGYYHDDAGQGRQ
jgi:succinoglycan biosynthesis transport protein ExoP